MIGIVADVGNLNPEQPPHPLSYSLPGATTGSLTLVARTRVRQDSTLADIRREMSGLVPNTVVTTGWWSDTIDVVTEFRNPRFQTLLALGLLGTLALGLAALGIFSVVAFLVASRFTKWEFDWQLAQRRNTWSGWVVR